MSDANEIRNRLAAVTASVERVSEQTGAPFLEALALFEDYATKMVQFYNLMGGYPDFGALFGGIDRKE